MKYLKNINGITLIELLIGMGLASILSLIVVTFQYNMSKEQISLTNKLEQSIDKSLADNLLFKDLKNINPSYNNLILNDDNNLGFFDYYPDIPANLLTNSLRRSIKINAESTDKSFFMLTNDISAGQVLNYDPTAAYEIGAAPTDFNIAATLTFKGLNQNNWVKSAREKFWINGMTLMLDTPVRLRPVAASGSIDMKDAPHSPIFIGTVDGDSLKALTEDTQFIDFFKFTQPETGAIINSVDDFLRYAPSVGGGQPLIRLRAVKVIKYYLEPTVEDKKDCASQTPTVLINHSRLFKAEYINGEFSSSLMLADKVCSFELIRNSVLNRIIYYKITKVDSKDNNSNGSSTTGF